VCRVCSTKATLSATWHRQSLSATGTASERRGNHLKYFDGFYLQAKARIWPSRPEYGLDCLTCAMFVRQRSDGKLLSRQLRLICRHRPLVTVDQPGQGVYRGKDATAHGLYREEGGLVNCINLISRHWHLVRFRAKRNTIKGLKDFCLKATVRIWL